MEQRRDRRTSKSTRNQMEVQPTRSTSLWWSMGAVGEKLQESNVCSVGYAMYAVSRSATEDVLSTTMCFVEQTLNARPLTPVSSDVNDLKHWPPITSCLATRTFAYLIYHAQMKLLIIENSLDKLKPMQISYGTDFVKNICQLWIIGKNGDLRRMKALKKAIGVDITT